MGTTGGLKRPEIHLKKGEGGRKKKIIEKSSNYRLLKSMKLLEKKTEQRQGTDLVTPVDLSIIGKTSGGCGQQEHRKKPGDCPNSKKKNKRTYKPGTWWVGVRERVDLGRRKNRLGRVKI